MGFPFCETFAMHSSRPPFCPLQDYDEIGFPKSKLQHSPGGESIVLPALRHEFGMVAADQDVLARLAGTGPSLNSTSPADRFHGDDTAPGIS
ncbi:hypothetical protein ACMDCR_20740 [Labrys okinawensis]|uniref:hypothetical protein n=1 Tax=Labrys okinawensis TaxID=346911 RepID=UPI0039BC507F